MGKTEQTRCAANGHQPWVIATKVVHEGAFGEVTKRVRYCTGCGMDRPSRRVKKEGKA